MLIAHMMKFSNQLMMMIQLSTSYLSNDDYDDSGVLAPNHDKDLVLDKFPLDADLISRELYTKDDKEEADFGKHDCEYKSEICMKMIVPMSPIIWQDNGR